MNLVDSSGWLEYFANGRHADFFAPALEDTPRLIVPSICIFEVFKRVLQQKGEDAAIQAAALMQQAEVIPLDMTLSVYAARLSFELKLPMADSIIYATAKKFGATIWTQDEDFKTLPNVKFIKRKK